MRARVCVLAFVVPRRMMVVTERSSFLRSLIACAVLVMLKRYGKRAWLSTNLNYGVLSLQVSRMTSKLTPVGCIDMFGGAQLST